MIVPPETVPSQTIHSQVVLSETVLPDEALSVLEGSAGNAAPLPVTFFRPEEPADADAVEALNAVVFGPGRFARTASRLREGTCPDPDTSLVALRDGVVVGSVRQTLIGIGSCPALLLGPLAVRSELRGQGIGKALMRLSMEEARRRGHRLILLVGDQPFYWPFGFRKVPEGRAVMPGPVDPERLLWAELATGAAIDAAGPVRAIGL